MIKNIYIESLIITIFIFLSGIMVGIYLDNYRLSKIRENLLKDTIYWDDSLFLTKYSQFYNQNQTFCNKSYEMNLLYNQKIYERGKYIENAIKLDKFSPEMKEELKKYTLMQLEFWMNSIELKRKCNFNYHIVVHFQKFFPKNENERIENMAESNVIMKLKQKCGNKIMLIPVYTDLNLTSVNAIMIQYNITKVPSVLIDEKYLLEGPTSLETLENYTGC